MENNSLKYAVVFPDRAREREREREREKERERERTWHIPWSVFSALIERTCIGSDCDSLLHVATAIVDETRTPSGPLYVCDRIQL